MITKLKAQYIITHENNKHQLIENGVVVYENDIIIYVGHEYKGHVDETIDVGQSIVSPGFIDLDALGDVCHDQIHIEQPAHKIKNLLWSQEYIENGPKQFFSLEEESFKSLYAYSQLILSGVTTAMPITSVFYKQWAETFEEMEAAAENAKRLGLRVYLGPSFQYGIREVTKDGEIRVHFDEAKGEAGLERAVAFVKKYDRTNNDLIRGVLVPERIETQTEDSLRKIKQYSKELNCPVRLHAAQGEFEYNEIKKRSGKTPVQFLHSIGFLDEHTSIPHVCCTSESMDDVETFGNDLDIIAQTNTTVIHCPVVMARHGVAINSFASYREKGINIALGTDTFPTDMFQNIRIATILSRVQSGKVAGSTYADLFEAATIGGAKFLGRDDLGKIAVGAKADMIVVDLSSFHIGAIDDPFRTMCLAATESDISQTIINGKTVMKDRQIPGIDLNALKEQGQKHFEKLKSTYVERDYQHLGAEELFTPGLSYKSKGR